MSEILKPQVSQLFQPSTRIHGTAWYRSDIPDTSWDATFDEDPIPKASVSATNPSKERKIEDKLCQLCSSLDLQKAFHYGLPKDSASVYYADIGGIFYGSAKDIERRKYCPLCRLITKLYCAKYRLQQFDTCTAFITVDEIACSLFTVPSDQVGCAGQLNGPPIHYLDFRFYVEGRECTPLVDRYLMLDGDYCNLVDNTWVDIQNMLIATDECSSDSEPDEADAKDGKRAVVEYGSVTDTDDSEDEREPDGQPRRYYNTGRQIRQCQVDFDQLKSWLNYCEEVHEWRGCMAAPSVITRSFRVIDVKARKIIPMPGACRYAALSYVWGAFTEDAPEYSLDQGRLPHAIEDAMLVVERVGERYLWVDAYCINQDDTSDKAAQVKLMHKIYNSALFTIVAATGTNSEAGLAGVYPGTRLMTQESEMVKGKRVHLTLPMLRESLENPGGPRKLAKGTGWISRGWTMQEGLLSRRCLVFSSSQVFFQCCSGFCAESITEVLDNQRRGQTFTSNQTKDLLCGNLVRLMDNHEDEDLIHYDTTEYFRFIKDYTRRTLSFNSDRLHAIKGITTALQMVYGTTFLYGLPQGALDYALLWVPTSHNNKSERDKQFPSWSWASWQGSIDYYVYDNDSAGANELLNTSGDLLETGANIRKHNTYWKYSRAGANARPKQIVQKQVRYPVHIEKKYGCTKKDGKVKLDTHVRDGQRPQMHLWQLEQLVTETPLLDRQLRGQLGVAAGDETALPVIGFNGVRASLYLVRAEDCARSFQCRCKAVADPQTRVKADQLDECIFVDHQDDAQRVQGQLCDFIFLSICEPTRSPYTLLINVMLVERCVTGGYRRMGIGYVRSQTWAAATQVEETVFLL